MKLKSFSYLIGLLIIFYYPPLFSDEKIDIWNNKKATTPENLKLEKKESQESSTLKSSQTIETVEKIQIEEGATIEAEEQKVFGIYDPSKYDFSLNMWSTTKADDLRSSLNRLKK